MRADIFFNKKKCEFISENYGKISTQEMMQRLNFTNKTTLYCYVTYLKNKEKIDKRQKSFSHCTWYQQEIIFLMKYYQILGFNYCCKRLNKTKSNLDYLSKKINLPSARKALSKNQRILLWLRAKGYKKKQIAKILNMTENAYNKLRTGLFKKIGVKNQKTLIDFANKFPNLINVLLLDEEKKFLNTVEAMQ